MNSKISFLSFLIVVISFIQCKKNVPENAPDSTVQLKEKIISNATTFDINEHTDFIDYQMIRGNDTVHQKITKSQLPFKQVAIFSSSAIGYITALNAEENIKVVYNSDWIYSPLIHEKLAQKEILDGGNAASANLEIILSQQPDAIIAYTDPNQSKLLESVKNLDIPVIYIDEYLEKTPLGKAEYLKLFGILFNTTTAADSLYTEIQNNYMALKQKVANQENKPTVFAEVMRGDIWYMPGGNSFQARYFVDAGANYLWAENENSGTVNLNFEQVFEKAQEADYWMNAADFASLKQLKDAYKNHEWFEAFQQQKVYSISNRTNQQGANDYFEMGNVRADWVLRDLIQIFHPTVLSDSALVFYHQLD